MRFIVRDDDTSAMTRPEELEARYQDIWDEVPVCLSVTPFRIPGRSTGVPESLLDSTEVMPLAGNVELVSFLREQIGRGRFEIALHGYHHDRPAGLAEYQGGQDLHRKAIEGRRYLEDVLECEVLTFVPPNNTLSAEGFSAVVGAGLNLVNNQTRVRLEPAWSSPRIWLETAVAARYAIEARLGQGVQFRVRSFPGYQQAPYHTVGPDTDLAALQSDLRRCHATGGVFVMATHYHAFDKRTRSGETIGEGVFRLIDEARGLEGTRFVAYSGLW